MGEVGDHGAFHLEVDLDRRAAQLRVRGSASVGVAQAAETGDIAGQFDDFLVVAVVQHRSRSSIPGPRHALPTLGGPVPRSYIWTGTAEIQSAGSRPST